MRGTARCQADIERVLSLLERGLSDYEVARRTGIPRSTVFNWRRGRQPITPGDGGCTRCRGAEHDYLGLPASPYAYLLGQYLGDGTVFATGKLGRGLRISSDAQYPGIIEECSAAIETIRGRRPYLRRHTDKRLVSITSYWRS